MAGFTINLPNLLTLARIFSAPLVCLFFLLQVSWGRSAAALVFLFAALTDVLDGWIARRYGKSTRFGAFLDPVADKLIVTVTLVLIVGHNSDLLTTLAAMVIVGREIVVSALREWMAELGKQGVLASSHLAKVKTVAQMTAITLLLYQESLLGMSTLDIGKAMLLVAAALTLWSMFSYLLRVWKWGKTA